MPEHKSIGHLLVEQGIITESNLQKALAEQSISGKKLGDILVDSGYASEEQVVSILSEQMGLAYIDLNSYQVESEVIQIIDAKIANKFQVIPIFKIENILTVVMADPLDIQAVDELNAATGLEIQPVFGTKSAIRDSLPRYYGTGSELKAAVNAFKNVDIQEDNKHENIVNISAEESENDAPAIKFVNLILSQAIRDGASDIHFEPAEDSFGIRCRIDGILYAITPPPQSLQGSIISRLKVLANLDIAEKRLPQDGRVQIMIDSKIVDLRVSSFPTIFGENVVMRILDKSMGILSVEKLGMQPEMLRAVREVLNLPNGIILVTGPTGSGKTTSLYGFLNEVNREDRNIMTMEDPVEYQIKGIRQAQVDVKAGFKFDVGLRSILRQDPDVIMIGEIRDLETAEIAIQASLTGHLVFSTLHTNDAPSSINRLVDMGMEPFLVSSSLAGIVSQRLVRKLCDACKKTYAPNEALIAKLGLPSGDYTFYEENGCDKCRGTGYRGRVGIFELLVISHSIRQLINERRSAGEIEKAARMEGFRDMKYDGAEKIVMGITSVTEILRAT